MMNLIGHHRACLGCRRTTGQSARRTRLHSRPESSLLRLHLKHRGERRRNALASTPNAAPPPALFSLTRGELLAPATAVAPAGKPVSRLVVQREKGLGGGGLVRCNRGSGNEAKKRRCCTHTRYKPQRQRGRRGELTVINVSSQQHLSGVSQRPGEACRAAICVPFQKRPLLPFFISPATATEIKDVLAGGPRGDLASTPSSFLLLHAVPRARD
ncbi:hypothetical protein MRX96_046064 [Rhipicephalus microplus]